MTWKNHGTKILGAGAVFIGVLAAVDHEYFHVVANVFGPKLAPHVLHFLVVAGGLATAYRGVANQQHAQQIADTQQQLMLLQQQMQLQALEKQAQVPK